MDKEDSSDAGTPVASHPEDEICQHCNDSWEEKRYDKLGHHGETGHACLFSKILSPRSLEPESEEDAKDKGQGLLDPS